MRKTESSIHCRSIVLVLFVVSWACWVSLETEAKDGKVLASRNDINGAGSSEWFEPAEDAAGKSKGRSGRTETGGSERPKKGPSSPSRSSSSSKPVVPSKGSSSSKPVVPSKGSSSQQVTTKNTEKKKEKKANGAVYIITMKKCKNQPSPPFAKVGYSTQVADDCKQRVQRLQTGNPHKLICKHQFFVTVPRDAEKAAHTRLDELNLNLETQHRCDGGSEWYLFPDGNDVQSLIEAVRDAITRGNWLVSEKAGDWVESSINPSLSPSQSPQFVYNSKWRQVPCKGDVLQHITYNCK